MGQNTSRHHRTTAPSSSSIADPAPAPPDPSAQDSEPTLVSPPRRSRRESVRKSILNLVKPSLRVDSPTRGSRKSWRNSRRWSKAPSELAPPAESSQSAGSSTTLPSPATEKGKGVERDPDTLLAEQQGESSARPSTLSSLADVSESTVVDLDVAENLGSATQTPDEDEVVISPDPPLEDTPAEPQVEFTQEAPADGPAPAVQQTPVHQFPPPGTLVVVQGVVHTTDVPRPSAPSTSQLEIPDPAPRSSSTPPTAHNRLSSLLQSRPASMIGSRPASTIGTIPPSTILDATPSSEVEPTQPHTTSRTDLPSTNLSNSSNPSSLAQAPAANDPPSGTISSGSIDVLGTLLSVAAAATAASLLTGTSQPLLLPSSVGPSYNPEPNNPLFPGTALSEPTASRPTSPTPTAGLGLDAPRAERLRQAWGSIRERLGLRPTTPSSPAASAPVSTSDTDSTSTPPSGDPREHLFGQMARAFNLGLGLASESASAPARSGDGEQAGAGVDGRADGQLPAEGSFERFLIDLQTDLRIALTSTNDPPASEELATESASAGPPISFAPPDAEDGNDAVEDDNDMPPLGDITDSDSEFEDAQEEEAEEGEAGVPITSAFSPDTSPSRTPDEQHRATSTEDASMPITSAQPQDTSTTQGSMPEVDAQGRINWWRLYRFPPITVSPAQGIPATTSVPASIPAASTAPSPFPPSSPIMDPTLSELPFAHTGPPSPQPPSSQPRAYTVVPVIVVGVQSVNATWQLQPPTDEDLAGAADDVPDTIPLESDAATQRENGRRGWQSRAAEAIRSLRPGRRNRNAGPANGPGSRTFLIYVIGGYYPPNHSILNGGPDTLASLEALLELADLLGHTKPPTASKEDIEKSGLEIIKSTQLAQYEKEEKISSNCIERCLICLDDYQPEDDIRVMKCRHAFHQNCVDKWLETGRNNCPACRSTGVSVDTMPDA